MQTYLTYALLGFLLMASSCQGQKEGKKAVQADDQGQIILSGSFAGGSGMEVILEEMAAEAFIPLDTAICDEEGRFSFEFSSDHIAFYALRTRDAGYHTLLLEPGEKAIFEGSRHRDSDYTVRGSRGSELLARLSGEHRATLQKLSQIARIRQEKQDDADFAAISMELDRRFDSISEAFKNYSLDFIRANEESLSILVALYNLYGQGLPVFHPESDLDTYVLVDSLLRKQYGHMDLVQQLHAQVSEALGKEEVEKKGPGLQKGEFAPDFVSSRPDGSQVALRQFRGSWVLLSFWASWSPGSRMENPYLAKAWLNHKEEKFMIIQVGIEGDPARWTEAIRQDGLGWVQASDMRRWNTPVADLYQLERIPANFLIDPEGRIQARDLFGEDLVTHLNQLF